MSEDLEADVEAAQREQHVRRKPHANMDKRWWRGVEKLVLAAGGVMVTVSAGGSHFLIMRSSCSCLRAPFHV